MAYLKSQRGLSSGLAEQQILLSFHMDAIQLQQFRLELAENVLQLTHSFRRNYLAEIRYLVQLDASFADFQSTEQVLLFLHVSELAGIYVVQQLALIVGAYYHDLVDFHRCFAA